MVMQFVFGGTGWDWLGLVWWDWLAGGGGVGGKKGVLW